MLLKRMSARIINYGPYAPKNADAAFALRNEIDHPIQSKNRQLTYCLHGEYPLGRRVRM